MRKLTLPALADPSADHYSPAAFPDRGSSFLLPVGTALCASHHATKKIILQIKLHFLHEDKLLLSSFLLLCIN